MGREAKRRYAPCGMKKAAGGSGRRPRGCPPRRAITLVSAFALQSNYSNPSFRICELAFSVLPPRNHADFIQLTLLNATDALTVIVVPATAVDGSGVTVTTTPFIQTPVVYACTAA